jgi:hypothetical protein
MSFPAEQIWFLFTALLVVFTVTDVREHCPKFRCCVLAKGRAEGSLGSVSQSSPNRIVRPLTDIHLVHSKKPSLRRVIGTAEC